MHKDKVITMTPADALKLDFTVWLLDVRTYKIDVFTLKNKKGW